MLNRISRLLVIFALSLLIVTSLMTAEVFAFNDVSERDCYFTTSSNSSPIWNNKMCEVISSTGQGYYFYEVKFNSQRKYVLDGSSEGASGNAPESSTLNGKRSKKFDEGKYSCWEVRGPYLKVCMSR